MLFAALAVGEFGRLMNLRFRHSSDMQSWYGRSPEQGRMLGWETGAMS
ncbi:unnamed protein product [Staurois parvus]|uniref:Uncharacterized protein n=1 Tax=Staurois parvus TaxID=386267 RepID=A0ABN9H513_9NEOB|nr:unnamed protein product [Staurois parvus]